MEATHCETEAGASPVLQVGQELGVKDRVTLLDVVDGEEGVHGSDSDDEENYGGPDRGLSAREQAGVALGGRRGRLRGLGHG